MTVDDARKLTEAAQKGDAEKTKAALEFVHKAIATEARKGKSSVSLIRKGDQVEVSGEPGKPPLDTTTIGYAEWRAALDQLRSDGFHLQISPGGTSTGDWINVEWC